MPQINLYVPHDVALELRKRAKAQGLSLSRYLAHLAKREVGSGWPPGYFEAVLGGWQGEPLERPPQGALEQRADL